MNYSGDSANADQLSSYAVYDIGARYVTEVAGHPLTLRLEAHNISGKAYWANGSVVGDPRAVMFSATTEL